MGQDEATVQMELKRIKMLEEQHTVTEKMEEVKELFERIENKQVDNAKQLEKVRAKFGLRDQTVGASDNTEPKVDCVWTTQEWQNLVNSRLEKSKSRASCRKLSKRPTVSDF